MKILQMKRIVFLLLLILAPIRLTAQVNANPKKLSSEFLSFFIGNWAGDGEFANGKKISSDLNFKIGLDSSWIIYEHTDRLPNRYKAISMWGLDIATGQFVAYTFDNFHGHRKFVSDGWKENRLVLTTNEFHPQKGLLFQHFIYEKLSDKTFKMTFETSKDGIVWKLGDHLMFIKK
jgi:hypothetical protein